MPQGPLNSLVLLQFPLFGITYTYFYDYRFVARES